jgi:drug/metabolite transporter (DMT)-like permease
VDPEDEGAGVGDTEDGEPLGLTVALDEPGEVEGADRWRWWRVARAVWVGAGATSCGPCTGLELGASISLRAKCAVRLHGFWCCGRPGGGEWTSRHPAATRVAGHALVNPLILTAFADPVAGGWPRTGALPAQTVVLTQNGGSPQHSAVGIAVTLVAALLLGCGFVLQQHAAERAPKTHFLRLALLRDLLRKRRWLAGIAVMVAGQLLSAWSVSHISLSLAEPLLSTNLLFALALAVPLSRQRLHAIELIGVVLLSGGVAALSVARTANSPAMSFASPAGWLGAATMAAVAEGFLQAGRLRYGLARATLTATAAGLVFGIADALTRQTVHVMDTHSFTGLLTTWPGYSLVCANLVGLWLMENAFNTAPLHASLPAISAAEPAAGIVLGIIVFGDEVSISPVMIAVQIVGVVALVAGVVLVARAPALADLRPTRLAPHLPVRPRGSSPPSATSPSATPAGATPAVTTTAATTPAVPPLEGQTARHRASHQE